MARSYLMPAVAALLALMLAIAARGQPAPRRNRSPAAAPLVPAADSARAQGMYERLCLGCHGATGAGDGPLARFFAVSPRDFTRGAFKWRSTPSGRRPAVSDVAHTIARGVPGSGMPAFGPALRPADRELLARYVLAMNPGGASPEVAPEPVVVPAGPNLEGYGAEVYRRLGCASCHGDTLRGDGPAAATLRPAAYDLTREPPRGGGAVEDIVRSLRTGLDGTTMPAFGETVPARDLVAVAEFVRARAAPTPQGGDPSRWLTDADAPGLETPPPSGLMDPLRIDRENALWVFPLAAQGDGPRQLTPAERSLAPEQCARCHAAQFASWRTTVHARAMGPGVMGQLVDMAPAAARACQTCHAPLAEQDPAQPAFEPALREQGIVCAGCHLRGRERFGPVERAGRAPGSLYPLTVLARYERGDFCAPCHQHAPDESVAGMPVLDTVREWISGPYFARGTQCQQCHMPDREHSWRGAHDPDAVRQAVRTSMRLRREGGALVAEVRVENIGTGHAFPGTTTPAAVLEIEWLDARGARTAGPTITDTMQRHLEWDGSRFVQRFDTRIAPGAVRVTEARTTDATVRAARYTLTFRPDDYYAGFYAREAGASWRSARGRELLEQARARAEGSAFVVRSETVTVVGE